MYQYNGRTFFVRQGQQYIRFYFGVMSYLKLEVRMCRNYACPESQQWDKLSDGGDGYFDWHGAPQQPGKYILTLRYIDVNGSAYPTFEHVVYVMPPAARAFKGTDVFTSSKPNAPSTIRRSSMLLWSKGTTAATTLDRPMIVVEGIDAENKNDHASYLALGSTTEAPLFTRALDLNGDLLFLDFADGGRDMRANADQVIGAVEYIRNARTPSSYNFDVAAVSMGGVVARYALAKFEQEAWRGSHGVKHFVSIDAPQTGAVFDIAMQDYMIEKGVQPLGLTCMAAKQLLRTNRFDSYGQEHARFFADLQALNGGAGFPQQTQNIGVSFGTPALNPHHGQEWAEVAIDRYGDGQFSLKRFAVLAGTAEGGSYLPRDVTQLWGYSGWGPFPSGTFSYEIRRLDPYDPTFIPHNSALAIENGVSRFPDGSRFSAQAPSYHNVFPRELVQPLLDRLGYVDPPLAVAVQGPTALAYNATGTWAAMLNRSDASGYTYEWWWRIVMTTCDEDGSGARVSSKRGTISPQRVSQCVWSQGSTAPTFTYRADTDATLELYVTARKGTESATSPVFSVRTGNGPSGPLLAAAPANLPALDEAAAAREAPAQAVLERVWPVPARADGRVQVAYGLGRAGTVRLEAHDLLGRRVWHLGEARGAGWHVAAVDTEGWPSGTYLLTFTAEGQSFTRRFVLR